MAGFDKKILLRSIWMEVDKRRV